MKRLHLLIILGVIVLLVLFAGLYIIKKKMTQSTLGLIIAGDIVNSESLVTNLESNNRDLVMISLGILAKRKDTSGKTKAIKLLKSTDNYIWLNAALYLGAIKEKKAIPYLIKALKHPASRSYNKIASLLEAMTGQAFGKNQKKWIEWWKKQHHDSSFVFSYLDLQQKALDLKEEDQFLINSVVDPLRISHVGPQIRLIGIKLKKDTNPKDAVFLLRTLLAAQFVQLKFDNGPKLDEQGARRAFVYWTMSSSSILEKMNRKNLPSVPFTKKTLINTYLLKSGLYEIDLSTIEDEKMKQTLQQAAETRKPLK